MRRMIPVLKAVVLLVIAPAVIYFASLSKSVRLWREYQDLERSISDGTSRLLPVEVQAGIPLLSTGDILATVMPACRSTGVSVVSYSPEMVSTASGMGLCRAELVLSGSFTPLLSVMGCFQELTQIKTAAAEFRCDERMRREDRIQLRLELVQLEILEEVDNMKVE